MLRCCNTRSHWHTAVVGSRAPSGPDRTFDLGAEIIAKRHPALIPVARDHHECLIFGQRLMHGTKASDGEWPREPAQQAATLAAFFERHLRQHFIVEEEIVFPAACSAGSEAETLVAQLLDEHREMASLVERLAMNPQVTAAELAAFGRLLNDHIRLEDRQLFPLMETQISAAALLDLQQRVEARYS